MKYLIHREGEKGEMGEVTLTALETGKKSRKIELAPSLAIYNHSPTGFEFGYGGSGPAQLALAILLDYTGIPDLAIAYHQRFKWEFISGMGHPGEEIDSRIIEDWLKKERTKYEDRIKRDSQNDK